MIEFIPRQNLNLHHLNNTSIENLVFRLNQILSNDIKVLSAQWAAPNFHARFTPVSRTYQYKIVDGGQITKPLDRYDSAEWFRKLDITLMNEAASQLLGEHDFFAFCKFRQGASTVKNLMEFNWSRNNDGVVIGQITADSFGYNMVRNLVGAAVCVGEGRFDSAWVKKVLDEKVRISDSYVFPAKGLTLISINYPPENQYLDRYNHFQDWQDLDAVEG